MLSVQSVKLKNGGFGSVRKKKVDLRTGVQS